MAHAARKEPAEININLMPTPVPSGALGSAVYWILAIGRYLIIFTEIIALSIFVLGIKLSADKNDLNEIVKGLSVQVSQQEDFEQNFRLTQQRINTIKNLRDGHFEYDNVIAEFLKLLPSGLTLDILEIKGSEVSFSGSFSSPSQLQTLVSSFSKSGKISGLDIITLNSPTEKNPLFTFTAKAVVVREKFGESQ